MKDHNPKAERIVSAEQDLDLYMCTKCFELLHRNGKCPKCGIIYKIGD
ncbi:MAG TPA: hypothetical protein VMV49_02175 [Candidatus Deferrimicrobium sp.]|nr:hypothetical protein [Candidatus Deferrimicrobium sp.]